MTSPNRSEAHRSNGINRHSDLLVLLGGGVLSGALGLGGAILFGSWADTGSGVGPTAASLNEAFSKLFGAAIGLALGSAVVAFAVRLRRRLVTGMVAGLVGYALILAPALIVAAPSDVSTGESASTALLAAILLMPAVLAGALVGAAIADHRARVSLK